MSETMTKKKELQDIEGILVKLIDQAKQREEIEKNSPLSNCSLETLKAVGKQSDQLPAIHGMILKLDPQNQIEEMLVSQMVATHYAALKCLDIASRSSHDIEIRHLNLNSATKLTRTFTAQMEALNRHRGKGQQKMTVEHVHVNAGGQAIIGNVQSGEKKKKGWGGSNGGKAKK